MDLGTLILFKRKEKNLTQLELGDLLKVSDKTISKWETNRGIPETTMMPSLAKALGISLEEIFACLSNDSTITQPQKANPPLANVDEKLAVMIVTNVFCFALTMFFFADFVTVGDFNSVFRIVVTGYDYLLKVSPDDFHGIILMLGLWLMFLSVIVLALNNTLEYLNITITTKRNLSRWIKYICLSSILVVWLSVLFSTIHHFAAGLIVTSLLLITYYLVAYFYSKNKVQAKAKS